MTVLTAAALSCERQVTKVWAPMPARALAVSYPIPVLAPVTSATFPPRSTTGYDRFAPMTTILLGRVAARSTVPRLYFVTHAQRGGWQGVVKRIIICFLDQVDCP